MFYTGEGKERLCNVIKIEDIELPGDFIYFGHKEMQHTRGEWKANHRLQYLGYLIP